MLQDLILVLEKTTLQTSKKAEQELLEEKWANAVENNYTFYVDGQEVDEKYLIKDAYIIEYDDENCVVKLAYKSEVN